MVDSLNSTRHPPPSYQLKRPVQGIPLDDLLDATAEDLLGSVVNTLQDHSQRYACHLDRQRLLYSSYVKTMARSHVPKLSTKTVTKSCDKSTSCRHPAIFQAHSAHMHINEALKQEALNTRKHATECFFTMVDPRVCTQTAVSLSRINSLVCQISHPALSNIQHRALLDLAWSCLVFLWENLKRVTDYPPVNSFLDEASEVLAPIISGNTTTMDRLLNLLETDHQSLVFLSHAFQYNHRQHSMAIQRYQHITHIIIKAHKASLLEKSSLLLSQQLPALLYLIGSFDIDSWANSDSAKDETKRQAFYQAGCEFIRRQGDWQREYADADWNSNDGIVLLDCHSNNLVSLALSHMMTVMTAAIQSQKETTQTDHLYVLHLLLDTLATAHKNHCIGTVTSCPEIITALDTFVDIISQQGTKALIVTQQQWKQQKQPDMQFKWLLLNDPAHTIGTIHTINAQICAAAEKQQTLLGTYGEAGCMAIARLIFGLLLDSRIEMNFSLLIRCFEPFWKPSPRDDNGQNSEHSKQQGTTHHTTDAQLYITQLFELLLHLLLADKHNDGNDTTVRSVLSSLHRYFYEYLLYQLDTSWMDTLLMALTTLPWDHLSPLCSDIMEVMISSCLQLRKDDHPKFITYSTLVYSILQQTIIANHQQPMAPLDHHRFLQYVELSLILLMSADWNWPNEVERIGNIDKLWVPIAETPGELKADDMILVIKVTCIDDRSNWRNSLDSQEKNGILDVAGDQNCLAICIRWLRHLTVGAGDFGNMKLVAVFGRFILAHLEGVGDIRVKVNWLKMLLDQADNYMAKHDNTSDFNDCIDWLRVLTGTILGGYQQHNNQSTTDIEAMVDTICDAIFICDYNTTLAMFAACMPLTPSTSPRTPSVSSAYSTETLTPTIHRLKIMEHCLEHCLQLRHSDDIWVRVGTLLCHTSINNNNQETAMEMVETSTSEYIRHSMDLSFFLVLNAYCHAKLQQSNYMAHGENKTTISNNNDHHVAEEIAAILSMAQTSEKDIQQERKKMVLVQLFAHLVSKNKAQNSLHFWLASIVSLTRTCTRWSTMANHLDEDQTSLRTMKNGSAKNQDRGRTAWNALVAALECFLASRLAIIGIPPYSGMIPKDNAINKMTPWLTILEQKSKVDISHKRLFNFVIDAIRDLDHWTLWELDAFILQLDNLSFVPG